MHGPIAITHLGRVRGFIKETQEGDNAHVFLGIPYALPPVDELRFEKPVAARPWKGVRDATKFGLASCPHHWSESKKIAFGEDSLNINIMRPSQNSAQLYPVLFLVHPSAFSIGSVLWVGGYDKICENLVSRGIVVVHFNYRLGPLGFASTGDSVLPGNLGLHDQALALKWTYENISGFNGNPHDITVWGLSSGACCASLLALSPYTRHYIKKTLHQSGSQYAQFACSDTVVDETKKLAKVLGFPNGTSQEIKDSLKKMSIEEMMIAGEAIGLFKKSGSFKWQPRVDGDFFPKDIPELVAERTPIPTMLGSTTDETLGHLNTLHGLTLTEYDAKHFGRLQLETRIREWFFPELEYGSHASAISSRVIDFYVNELAPKDAKSVDYLALQYKLHTHVRFFLPVVLEAVEKQKHGYVVYLYQNQYWRPHHFPQDSVLMGAMHINEMKPLFGTPLPSNYQDTEEDLKFKHNLINSMVNFIKTGNPSFDNVKWPPLTTEHPLRHLVMLPNCTVAEDYDDEQKILNFWLQLCNEYGETVIRTFQANRIYNEQKQCNRPRL